MIQEVGIREVRRLPFGEETAVSVRPSLLALDGERELTVAADDEVTVRVERDGPRVVDIKKAIRQAASRGFFTDDRRSKRG